MLRRTQKQNKQTGKDNEKRYEKTKDKQTKTKQKEEGRDGTIINIIYILKYANLRDANMRIHASA